MSNSSNNACHLTQPLLVDKDANGDTEKIPNQLHQSNNHYSLLISAIHSQSLRKLQVTFGLNALLFQRMDAMLDSLLLNQLLLPLQQLQDMDAHGLMAKN
jgi:hypothetical protein